MRLRPISAYGCKAQQLGDMLSQVCECTPAGKWESPPEFPPAIGFTAGWRRSPPSTGPLFVKAVLRCGGVGGCRRVEYQPARPNSHPTVWQGEHTEQPQLVSPVICLDCHMIQPVCNNTQGAEAGRSGNEMIHG